jgi:hypothetical protein
MSDALDRLEEERTKRREEDWALALLAAEFGFKSHEKGRNLEMTLSTLADIFGGGSASTYAQNGAPAKP